jgi:hypothetical protein
MVLPQLLAENRVPWRGFFHDFPALTLILAYYYPLATMNILQTIIGFVLVMCIASCAGAPRDAASPEHALVLLGNSSFTEGTSVLRPAFELTSNSDPESLAWNESSNLSGVPCLVISLSATSTMLGREDRKTGRGRFHGVADHYDRDSRPPLSRL